MAALDDSPEAWRQEALCAYVEPEIFFPAKGATAREAKQICARCRVQADCLDYAMKREELHGVWGGKSELERRKMRSRQRKMA